MKRLLFGFLLFSAGSLFAQTAPPDVQPEPVRDNKTTTDTTIFSFAETMPEYRGKDTTLEKFLARNLEYPEAEREAGKEGTVYISFIVEKNGSVSYVRPAKEIRGAPGFTQEAIRVLSTTTWKPGTMNGKPVRVMLTMPVRFRLPGKPQPATSICGGLLIHDDSLGLMPAHRITRMPVHYGGDSAMRKEVMRHFTIQRMRVDTLAGSTTITFVVDEHGFVFNMAVTAREGNVPEPVHFVAAQAFCGGSWQPALVKRTEVMTKVELKVVYKRGYDPVVIYVNELPPPPPKKR